VRPDPCRPTSGLPIIETPVAFHPTGAYHDELTVNPSDRTGRAKMSTERRTTPRKRHLRRAKLVFRNGCNVVDCVVLDLHWAGAKLQLSDWIGLPDRVELRIENGPTHMAEIRYRTMETIGVQFIGDSVA
jgi:hypothetical protein